MIVLLDPSGIFIKLFVFDFSFLGFVLLKTFYKKGVS